jgi:alpha-tubulin suppressor-like RCC1 family protein
MQVSAGGLHSCALTEAHDVLCWGDDSQAQLGLSLDPNPLDAGNVAADSDAAVESYLARFPRVLTGARQVAAGGAHTCALLEDGTVECWGRSAEGQVDGTTDTNNVDKPVPAGVTGASQIAAGGSHSCALQPGRGVTCWGSARYGQVGREQSTDALAPDVVPGTADATSVAAGVRHSCALLGTGHVVCWGELIDQSSGEPYVTPTPVEVPGLEDAVEISAGAGHSCALKSDRTVVCWGLNDSGQLGDGTTGASATPVAVTAVPQGAWHVAAGGGELDGRLVGHSCAVTNEFALACWGRNAEGQLGRGVGADDPNPTLVLGVPGQSSAPNLENLIDVSLGAFHSCAWRASGVVYSWGADTLGQLGSGAPGGRQTDAREPGRPSRVRRFGSSP